MLSTVALATIALSLPSASQDAPDRLFTAHGVELRADEDVFLLFAALNVAGYAEESERKGPPLRAPVFHNIRQSVRDALRRYKDRPSVTAVTSVFEKNAVELEDYLAAALADGALSPAAQKLQPKLQPVLQKFKQDVDLVKVFDELGKVQRDHAVGLLKGINSDLAAAVKTLGDPAYRAPLNLVVVPNPLDSHDVTRRVKTPKETILVVGPSDRVARQAVLEEALRPKIRALVKANYRSAKLFARSWAGLKTSRRIAGTYQDGQNYLTEALTRAMAFRIRAQAEKRAGAEADEEFVDEQAKSGMRWARGALRVIDKLKGGNVATGLGRALARTSP